MPVENIREQIFSDVLRGFASEFLDDSYVIDGITCTGEGTSILTIAEGFARSNYYRIWRSGNTTFSVDDPGDNGAGTLADASVSYLWYEDDDKNREFHV